jgi:Lar family restriction alleviation protein
MTPINCPFCGGAAICDQADYGYHQVLCRSVITCGAAGSPRPTSDEAIAAWNRRAGQHVQATEGALSWRCFHCDYVARTREDAIAHFGAAMNERPAVCIGRTALTEDSITWGLECDLEDASDDEAHAFERGVRFTEWQHGVDAPLRSEKKLPKEEATKPEPDGKKTNARKRTKGKG